MVSEDVSRASEIIGLTPPDQPDPRWHIRVRQLTKSFGTNLVLDDINLDLERDFDFCAR